MKSVNSTQANQGLRVVTMVAVTLLSLSAVILLMAILSPSSTSASDDQAGLILGYDSNIASQAITVSPPIGYGMAVVSVDDQTLELVEQAGFEWVLYYASWAVAEPFQGWYDWAWLDHAVAQCERHGLKIVMRVDRPPAWANGGGGTTASRS